MRIKVILLFFVSLLCFNNASADFLSGAFGKILSNGIKLHYLSVNQFSPSSSKAVATFKDGSVDIDIITSNNSRALRFIFYNSEGSKIDSSKGVSEFTFFRDLCGYKKSDEFKMSLGTLRSVWLIRSDDHQDVQISILNNKFIYIQYWRNGELTLSSLISYTPEEWAKIERILNKLK